ncbi:hypothetical protein HMPREF9447_03015 [Bacteroides oleiciplenus YIT 12058]|uniref:Pectate lyase superfamily protein domain-containing protein n=2 Tax=Bacteroides oleiciplenus TaxID=626931 RepID=K9EF54_9BACE|nr:hypothetical protein HMPREF9447_03015 [Bacteroides oleiciplenus YIT 12058]
MSYFSGDFFSRIHRDQMTINNQYFNYMKRRYTFSLLLSGALLLSCAQPRLDTNNFEWGEIPQQPDFSWAENVGSRQLPDSSTVVSANSFGAVADSTVLSTNAIQKAIDSCALSGGGTVTLQPGYYLTGALFVKSGVNLQISKGVTLIACPDIYCYPEFRSRIAGIEMIWPAAVINIIGEKKASVSGEGTLDCRGKIFWDKYWAMRKEYEAKGLRWIVDYDCKRVRGILVERSSDITLSNFTLMRTGFWGCQILYSDHCTVDGLNIDNNIGGHGPSTDGIDIDSSTNILIENCTIDCNDDIICLKAGRDADGLRVNRSTENVLIRNCTAHRGAGLITCGSETSGSIRNILAYDLKAIGTSVVFLLKSAMTRGGTVENVYVTRVEAENVRQVFGADPNWNPKYSYSTLPEAYKDKEIPEHWKVMLTPVTPTEKGYPHFRNIYLSQVKANNVQEFVSASGINDSLRLENFYLHGIEAQVQKAGTVCFTRNFNITEVKLDVPDAQPIKLKENEQSNIRVEYVKQPHEQLANEDSKH